MSLRFIILSLLPFSFALSTNFHASVAVSVAAADENNGKLWAFLVAGSSTYSNYRHQADVCHAFHVLRSHGVPESQIVVMMADDIAHNFRNPKKGQIFNEPNGPDVYAGVPKDYVGHDVTPSNFLRILQGDKTLGKGSGKVIDSNENDRVFVFFADHGAPGLIAFPSHFIFSQQLYARDLNKAILAMHQANKYKDMVLYIEACESGSMFNGILPSNISVFATTAATPFESSYACYYDSGVNAYLGDCYSNHWMEDSDVEDLTAETLQKQFLLVRNATTTSTVCEYGDLSVDAMSVATFQGNATAVRAASAAVAEGAVSSRDVNLATLLRTLENAPQELRDVVQIELELEMETRKRADATFSKFAEVLGANSSWGKENTCTGAAVTQFDCLEQSIAAYERSCGLFTDYSLRYIRNIVGACEAGVSAVAIAGTLRDACGH